jgi:hypothetical protein
VVLILIGSQSSGEFYDARALFMLMVMASCTSAVHPIAHGGT